jgi:ribokinase
VPPSAAVIGDALLDVHVVPSEAVRPGEDIPAAVRMRPGGQGANLAVRLARRGVTVALTCSLADDVAGRLLRSALESEGVTLHALGADATGVAVVIVDADGERTMLSQRVPFADAAADRVPSADWLVLSGYLLLEPGADALARSVAAFAGRRVLVGCAVPVGRVVAWRAAATAFAPDLVIMNADEMVRLSLDGAPDGAPGHAVTHAGGATVTIGSVRAEVPAPTGPDAVDTTGAGDAFAAALVAGLSDAAWPPTQSALDDALRGAVELAAAVAHARGAQARVATEGAP